jgi:predicted AAA+ superfamily ATPase
MNKTIYLHYINTLRERIAANTNFIQVILGPRQVGKTTTVLKLIEDSYQDRAHYVSADQVFNATPAWLREQWLFAQSRGQILFVDEIQKLNNWAEAVKALYDEAKRLRRQIICVLLGSSSLKIQQGLTESLTGRFQLIRAHHWNYQESHQGYALSFDQYLRFGGYPGSYQLINSNDWGDYIKNSIISTVIEKDILQYNTVKNPALFKQAFEILISYPAQEISFTKLLGQLQEKGNVELIKHYISLYEGAFLVRALEKYSSKEHLKRASAPKILPLAPCLPHLSGKLVVDQSEFQGRVFELAVGTQLVRTGQDLYYWREGQHEVDYVIECEKNLYAIEVKGGRRKSTTGLTAFKRKFPAAKLSIIDRQSYPDFEADPLGFLDANSIGA